MLTFLFNKVLVFILVFAILVVIHYILNFVKAFRTQQPLDYGWKELSILYSAISYILTIISTGLL